MSVEYFYLLIAAMTLSFLAGFLSGYFGKQLRRSKRDGTDRYDPRPGSQPFRPDSKLKPFKKSPDMCVEDE